MHPSILKQAALHELNSHLREAWRQNNIKKILQHNMAAKSYVATLKYV